MQHRPWRAAFNAAQYAIAFGAAALVLLASEGQPFAPGGEPGWADVGLALAAAAVWFVVNNVLVTTAVALRFGGSWWRALGENLADDALTTGSLLLLGAGPGRHDARQRRADPAGDRAAARGEPDGATVERAEPGRADRSADPTGQPQGATDRGRRPCRRVRAPDVGGQPGAPVRAPDPRHRPVQVRQRRARSRGRRSAAGRDRRSGSTEPCRTATWSPGWAATSSRSWRPTIDNLDDARAAASEIAGVLSVPVVLDGMSLDVGGSIGIAIFPTHGDDFATLLRHADVAMYDAKDARRRGRRLRARGRPQLAGSA